MIVLPRAGSPASRYAFSTRGINLLAVVFTSCCVWAFVYWYQGLMHQMALIGAERDFAIDAREQEAAIHETNTAAREKDIEGLKMTFDNELGERHRQIEELKRIGQEKAYQNYPGGQVEGADEIVVVIKTGATEALSRMPIQLATTLTHTPNYLLFSDHEQMIGHYTIQDSLDESNSEAIQNWSDFQLYRDLQQYIRQNQSAEHLDLQGGWNLDKYKNTHMMVKTYRQRPDAKWYYFMDADSYVMMGNLVAFLRGLDHNDRFYMGSATQLNNLPFGHGGSGYILSQGTMKAVLGENKKLDQKYEELAKNSCCGDYVVAQALHDHGIKIRNIHPHIQGNTHYDIQFDQRRMCMPILSLHHMTTTDINTIWEYEKVRARPGTYLLFADMFEHFIDPHLKESLSEWDNMEGGEGDVMDLPEDNHANGTEPTPYFERCKRVCVARRQCISYRIHGEECRVSNSLTLGQRAPMTWNDRKTFQSGWIMDRVEEIRKMMPCEQPSSSWPGDGIRPG